MSIPRPLIKFPKRQMRKLDKAWCLIEEVETHLRDSIEISPEIAGRFKGHLTSLEDISQNLLDVLDEIDPPEDEEDDQ